MTLPADDAMDLSAEIPKHSRAGSQRICTPEQTLARMLPLRCRFGITRLANVTGLDRIGVPVVIAVRPNARSIAISQGKGATLAHATASALMEAVEIWHAEHIDRPVYHACRADLEPQHRFVDLARLPMTPEPRLPETRRQHWIMAQEIISDTPRLVPLEMVHADYTDPGLPEAGQYPASTNGLASGNHVIEAVCHGICELVERDALSIWHARPLVAQHASRVDPGSIADVGLQHTLGRFAAAGLSCAIWDVGCDTKIPSFMALIFEAGAQADHLGLGSGTHPDPVTALHRALNEAAQTRLNYISGAREDLFEAEFTDAGRRAKRGAFADLLTGPCGTRAFAAGQGAAHATVGQDLAWLKQQLRGAGAEEIAVVDLTRADAGIPVVRVIIPGLEAPHDDPDYMAGPRARAARR